MNAPAFYGVRHQVPLLLILLARELIPEAVASEVRSAYEPMIGGKPVLRF
jgi:hypothetical protein